MSSSSSRAVSMMIGTVLVARRRLQTSSPSSRGSMMSSTTRSTGCSRELPQRLLAVGRLDDRRSRRARAGRRAPCARRPRRRRAGSWGRGRPSRRWPTVALGMSASPVSARGGRRAAAQAPRLARAARQRPPLPQQLPRALAAAADPRVQRHAARRRCRRRCCRRTSTARPRSTWRTTSRRRFPDRRARGAGLAARPRSGSATR